LDIDCEAVSLIKLVAVVLTVISHGGGAKNIYATKLANVTAMLNMYLLPQSGTGLARLAPLLEMFIQRTAARDLLLGSVGQHIARAKNSKINGWHLSPEDWLSTPEGRLLCKLAPEVFSASDRKMLEDFDALPLWAR
jgi:hypothetical protein